VRDETRGSQTLRGGKEAIDRDSEHTDASGAIAISTIEIE
jgi:hypothetical protein